jgi:hypothetical protein
MLRITASTYPGYDAVMELTINLYSVKGTSPLAGIYKNYFIELAKGRNHN